MKKENILAPISSGELIDKISILKIKKKKNSSKAKLNNINKELFYIYKIYLKFLVKTKKLLFYERELLKINKILWDIEDKIRLLESKKDFNNKFIDLARSVYINNDKRSEIKKKINKLTGSNLVEEKSYKKY